MSDGVSYRLCFRDSASGRRISYQVLRISSNGQRWYTVNKYYKDLHNKVSILFCDELAFLELGAVWPDNRAVVSPRRGWPDMALVHGSEIFRTRAFLAVVYAVGDMRRTDFEPAHANMRLRTVQPMTTSVYCASKQRARRRRPMAGLYPPGPDQRPLSVAGGGSPLHPAIRRRLDQRSQE